MLWVVDALKSEVFRVNLFPDSKVSVNKEVGVWEIPKFASSNATNTKFTFFMCLFLLFYKCYVAEKVSIP